MFAWASVLEPGKGYKWKRKPLDFTSLIFDYQPSTPLTMKILFLIVIVAILVAVDAAPLFELAKSWNNPSKLFDNLVDLSTQVFTMPVYFIVRHASAFYHLFV